MQTTIENLSHVSYCTHLSFMSIISFLKTLSLVVIQSKNDKMTKCQIRSDHSSLKFTLFFLFYFYFLLCVLLSTIFFSKESHDVQVFHLEHLLFLMKVKQSKKSHYTTTDHTATIGSERAFCFSHGKTRLYKTLLHVIS